MGKKVKLTKQEVESLKHSKKGYLLRPTAMNKAEELYHEIIEAYDELNYLAENKGIEKIKQYAQHVRGEAYNMGFRDGIASTDPDM